MGLKPVSEVVEGKYRCFESQSNHYGIETATTLSTPPLSFRRNRTIMGLKLFRSISFLKYFPRRNRTIMGLKLPSTPRTSRTALVAIEPLWDWNCMIPHVLVINYNCRNRTIMGLKPKTVFLNTSSLSLSQSNHYGIETASPLPPRELRPRRNRTIMGLKPLKCQILLLFNNVAIEPLWDWNVAKISFQYLATNVAIEPLWDWNLKLSTTNFGQQASQSNHYGIETS